MTEPLRHWLETTGTRGVRILVIILIAMILIRMLKAVTTRLVYQRQGTNARGADAGAANPYHSRAGL